MSLNLRCYATGRRKVAIARVWLTNGTGNIKVNNRELGSYFCREVLRMIINQPFEVISAINQYDIKATIVGGGLSGQAGALRHAISRALLKVNDGIFRGDLKKGGFLTRDARMVERKKYGRSGARKRYQYSKR